MKSKLNNSHLNITCSFLSEKAMPLFGNRGNVFLNSILNSYFRAIVYQLYSNQFDRIECKIIHFIQYLLSGNENDNCSSKCLVDQNKLVPIFATFCTRKKKTLSRSRIFFFHLLSIKFNGMWKDSDQIITSALVISLFCKIYYQIKDLPTWSRIK